MSVPEWGVELTEETIDALFADGSCQSSLYEIEHHFSAQDFAALEKAAVKAFELGYEVTDPEEVEDPETRQKLWAFSVVCEAPLIEESLYQDIERLLPLSDKFGVEYDGWGTYYQEPQSNP